MSLRLVTAAASQPVTLAEARLHLRLDADNTARDAAITAYIIDATMQAEQAMGARALMTQTWELTLDAFPDAFELTRVPVQSITSIKYDDTAGVEQTLASNLYTLDKADDFGPAFVVPPYATSWPATRDQINAVRLRFVAGYADAASVPESIKSWIKLMVGALDAHSLAADDKPVEPLGFADRLLDRYKVWKL